MFKVTKRQKINALAIFVLVAAVIAILIFINKPRRYSPSEVNFDFAYNDVLEEQIYPSLILGLAHYVPEESKLNDTLSFFRILATAPCDDAVLTVVVDSTQLNYTTKIQQVLKEKGERYKFYPILKWKYDDLYHIRRHGTVDFTIHCLINGEEVDVQNLRLSYRSANECLLSITDTAGRRHSFRWMFTAYVNEEHPYIDSILTSILSQGVTRRIVGYQAGNKEVVSQVEALWYYALDRGITYSSISTTSTPAKRASVQHIRFFEEVYNMRQANCIDACVFFSSVLRKIGLKPVIISIPGHAYLGYYTDKNRKNIKLLETTMTQWVDLPDLTAAYNQTLQQNPDAKGLDRLPAETWKQYTRYLTSAERARWANNTMTLDQLKRCISHNLFLKASDYNTKEYEAHIDDFNNPENTQYQIFDIENSRRVVQPIGGDY